MATKNPKLYLMIISSFLGRAWGTVLTFLFMPMYIRILGIEFVGLLGFFAAIQPILNLLDMGLSSSINREMANLSAFSDKLPQQRDLVRTLEYVYWGIGLLLAFALVILAPLAATRWIQAEQLDQTTITKALCLMGLSFAVRFPSGLYQGGLLGLQKHVAVNATLMVTGTVKALGAVVILTWVSPTVVAFFTWQLAANLIQVAALHVCQWLSISYDSKPRFSRDLLNQIKSFAAGMTGISLVTVVLLSLDKLLLVRLLGFTEYGYYALAVSVSSAVNLLFAPMYSAAFPRFSNLVATNETDRIIPLYHLLCQIVALLVVPAVIILSMFSNEIMFIWLNDQELANKSSTILTILVLGTGINGLLNVPYAFQLANGWTSLAFYQNLVSVLLFVPLLLLVALRYGAVGAASLWLALNASWILVTPHIMHSKLLKSEKTRWYMNDVLVPICGAIVVALLVRIIVPLNGMSRLGTLLLIGTTWLSACLAVIAVTPQLYSNLDTIKRLAWKQ